MQAKGSWLTSLLLLVCVLALSPFARAKDKEPDPPAPAGSYRRPLGNDPRTLDPARISDIYGLSVTHQIFDGLVRFDHTLTISPALAQYWRSSRDGLTWTFTLRKGVKFHHGREVTADDVVFSLTRILDPKTQSDAADLFTSIKGAQDFVQGRARAVSGLSAPDRHTVQVELNEALTPFVSVLAVGHARIVPRDIVEQQGEAFGANPVGTGPFKFVRWEPGKEIVLAANTDSFDGAPRLARLVYRIFPGEVADQICQEFEQGNLEESSVPSRCRNKISDPRYQYVRRPTFSVRFYGLNTRAKPLSRRSGSAGDRARARPRDDDPGDLPRPASARARHPARRHARLQPAAQDAGVQPDTRSCAAEGGGFPRGTRAARHRDLVGGPERAHRKGDAGGQARSSPPSGSPPRCNTRPTGRPSRSASPRAASPCSCMPGTRTCRIRTTSCSSSFTPRACAT